MFVDDKYSFSLTDTQLADLGLRTGDIITGQDVNSFKKLSKIGKLKDLALKWTMRRNHSEREITDYLKKKSDDPQIQKEILASLKEYGFVDDRQFAEEWLKSRRASGKSRFAIKGELIKKGISDEILEELFESDDSELEALDLLVNKKKHLARYQDRQKLMAYLASKGYRYDDIKEVLEGNKN